MDWWQIVLILLLIGLISIMVGIIAGIPISNFVLRRQNQISSGKYRISPKFESQLEYPTPERLDEFPEKHEVTELQAKEPGREATIEREEKETEVSVEQAEPSVIDRLLVELESNRELTIESNAEKLMPFQTHTWDESRDVLDMVSVNLQWELTQAYLDMVVANNIVWFLREFDRKSPDLDEQYVKMCKQIADRLDKIIPMLETAKQIAT